MRQKPKIGDLVQSVIGTIWEPGAIGIIFKTSGIRVFIHPVDGGFPVEALRTNVEIVSATR